MKESTLRYTNDRLGLIKMARNNGLSDEGIVGEVTRGLSYADLRVRAEIWAPLLGLTEAEFVRIARLRSKP